MTAATADPRARIEAADSGDALAELRRRLADSPLAGALERDRPLSAYTTYRVGGPAKLLATISNMSELETLAAAFASLREPSPDVAVLGRGSNLLVADAGFDGLAVVLAGSFAGFSIEGCDVTAGGAARLPVVARAAAEAGLAGFEWAVGVPGSVGGGVRMNGGGHGSDIKASISTAVVADLHTGAVTLVTAERLRLAYRSSSIRSSQIVASASFRLSPGDSGAARAQLSEIVKWRRDNQPGGRNSGSVFANPEIAPAGALIEAVGAKGLRIGGAQVSTKHANFIQADENACAADIAAVMREVRRRVSEQFGVVMRIETCIVGFEPSELL